MDVDLAVPLKIGGTCEQKFYQGMDDNGCHPLWVLENPNAYLDFVRKKLSEAEIICAPTFNATSEHLKNVGAEEKLEQINSDLVALAKSVGESKPIAGIISEVDLDIEPFGEVLFTQLMHIYRKQAEVLKNAGVEVFLLNAMTSMVHARAAVLALQKYGLPIFVTMQTDNNGELKNDKNIIAALVTLQKIGVSAFGLTQNFNSPEFEEMVKELAIYSNIPLIMPIEEGVSQLSMKPYSNSDTVLGEVMLADTNQVYNLFFDSIEGSELAECSVDMTDTFLELEDDSHDVIMLEINSVDDAKDFANNAHLATLPFCFCSHDEISLRMALMLYSGIAMINSDTSINPETLEEIAKKYGAVIY